MKIDVTLSPKDEMILMSVIMPLISGLLVFVVGSVVVDVDTGIKAGVAITIFYALRVIFLWIKEWLDE